MIRAKGKRGEGPLFIFHNQRYRSGGLLCGSYSQGNGGAEASGRPLVDATSLLPTPSSSLPAPSSPRNHLDSTTHTHAGPRTPLPPWSRSGFFRYPSLPPFLPPTLP